MTTTSLFGTTPSAAPTALFGAFPSVAQVHIEVTHEQVSMQQSHGGLAQHEQ